MRLQYKTMPTQTHAVTAEELEEISKTEFCELVNGELRIMVPPNDEHGTITVNVGTLLWSHVRKHRLGRVYAETGYRLTRDPDTVLGPDVSFIRQERVPAKPYRTFPPMVPDLVVEVVSPTDRVKDVGDKTEQWLAFGAAMVWVVWPNTRTIAVHRAGQPVVHLRDGDRLEGGDVVEGFACEVSEVFE